MAGKTPAGKKADEKDTAADDAAKAADESASDGKAGDGEGKDEKVSPPGKKAEKTYSKAELEAEKQKAIADAQKKWEDEKDLSELERIKKENEDLRAANRLRDAKDEVVAALTAAGNRSPDLAFNAIRGELKFDDAGKLVNSKDLIEGLKTSYPEQFGEQKPGETIDGGAGQDQKGTKLTKEAIEKMTTKQINDNWPEVSKVLAAG